MYLFYLFNKSALKGQQMSKQNRIWFWMGNFCIRIECIVNARDQIKSQLIFSEHILNVGRFRKSASTVRGWFRSEARTGSESDRNWLMDNWKKVMGRTWLQRMCCTHLYNMQVCPIISGWLLETGVGWRLDGGWREVQKDRELVRWIKCSRTKVTQKNTQ